MDKQKAIELYEKEKEVVTKMDKEEKLVVIAFTLIGAVVGILALIVFRLIF